MKHFDPCIHKIAGISGVRSRVVSKRVVLADVPPERKPERGYVRQNHPFGNRPFISPMTLFGGSQQGGFQKGGFGERTPGTKTGTRARSPKPPFYETALLSPSENLLLFEPFCMQRILSSFLQLGK